jgi:hypothetical protein
MTPCDACGRPPELREETMSTTNPVKPSPGAAVTSSGAATEAERAATAKLLRLVWAIHVSRCLYAVAGLGISDLLGDGRASVDKRPSRDALVAHVLRGARRRAPVSRTYFKRSRPAPPDWTWTSSTDRACPNSSPNTQRTPPLSEVIPNPKASHPAGKENFHEANSSHLIVAPQLVTVSNGMYRQAHHFTAGISPTSAQAGRNPGSGDLSVLCGPFRSPEPGHAGTT